jgi:hypothetical protein
VLGRERAARSEVAGLDDDRIEEPPQTSGVDLAQGQIPPVAREVSQTPRLTASELAYGDNDLDPQAEKHIKHCIDKLNEYRAAGKPPRPPLKEYRPLTMFAIAGSNERDGGGRAHAHIAKSFENDGGGPPGPRGLNAKTENQGFVSGTDIDACVDKILELMMAEGPGTPGKRNHHDNIMNPTTRFVGVGIVVGKLQGIPGVWLTTDFVGEQL